MKFHKVLIAICLFFTLILFLIGLQFIVFGKEDLNNKNRTDKINYNPPKYADPQSSSISSGSINFLILGLDGEEVRSDTIMLLNLNKANGKLNILSIPRDTKVETNKGYCKINSLIGIGGERLVCEKVGELTGLPVDFYVTLNYLGFKQIVDLLGGVEIYINKNMDYDDAFQDLHIHFKKGSILLNGEMAEQYVRYRKGNRRGAGYKFGDLTRMKVQQDFIISIIKQKAKLRYLQKLDDVFLVLKQYMKTNIELSDVGLFMNILKNLKFDEIKTYTLPGESTYLNSIWYYVNDNSATKLIIDKEFYK